MPAVLNKKGRPFSWSFSALDKYETCPAQYAALKFYCTTQETDNEANIWGSRVHKALEERVRDRKPLGEGMEGFEKWAAVVEATPGKKSFELQMALDRGLKPVEWFSRAAWLRVVVDVLNLHEARATLLDWKTGKVKQDRTQLALSSVVVSELHPEIEEFNCRFVWLKHDKATGEVYQKQDLKPIWEGIAARVERMEKSWATEEFPCNPSGLCRGWCPVGTCVHWKEKRR